MASAAHSAKLKNNINQLESNGRNLEQKRVWNAQPWEFEKDKLTPNFILIGQRAATTAIVLQTYSKYVNTLILDNSQLKQDIGQ